MFDISKYPLLNILIPLLSGMTGMSFCFDVINVNKWVLISIVLTLGLICTLTYMLTISKKSKPIYFTISFCLLFIYTGAVICLYSIRDAKERYGDNWRISVYKENPFRLESANKVQQSIIHFYHSHGINGNSGAIIEAITIGSKEHLSKSIKSDFSKAGVSHVLALSGFHISIIYIILQCVFLSRIVALKWRWTSNILLLLCLWTYAFISGMSPSLVRSVIMCTILMIGTFHTDQLISINGLALSALIMLCINPLLIFHVGFQLSYLSMIGIYILGIPLCKVYPPYAFIDSFLWCTICITISCTIITLPIVSHVFGQISTLSIFTNIIITVLMYIFFFVFFLWIITLGCSTISNAMFIITNYMYQTTEYISNISFATINIKFSLPEVILYYCILSIIVIILKAQLSSRE